jgi:hypothetical protein
MLKDTFMDQRKVLIYNVDPCRDNYGVLGVTELHSEELHNLYSSPSLIRIIKSMSMRWAGHVANMRARRNSYSILVGKPDGKRPL